MRIEVKDICFRYNKKTPLLDKVNLTIEAGEKVALVGPSGCGKVRFPKSLLATWATSGEILVDGNPLPHNCPYTDDLPARKAINPR